MAKKILCAVPTFRYDRLLPDHVRDRIAAIGELIPAPVPQDANKEFVLRHIGEAEILITSWGTAEVDADILAAAPRLRLVAHAAGSIKPVMTEAAWERGIRVTGAAQAIARGVAEHCLGLILTASKRVYWLADHIRRGYWSSEGLDIFGPPFEIYRQKVGIIGASFVGRKLIELLEPMECEILLYDPYCPAEKARELGAAKVQTLEELFSQCRVVSLNAPTTRETTGMIRGKHFALLQPGSLFINTARGVIINQEEMVKELGRGRFVACLDVTWPEPPAVDDALRRLPNVLITPHIAGALAENLMRIGEFVAEEIAAYCAGKPLKGEVKRGQLETIA